MDGIINTTQDLAILLLAYEWGEGHGRAELIVAVQNAFEKLSVHLSKRLGADGYRALLTRALALAAADFPWLGVVQITKDGMMEGFTEASAPQNLSGAVDGCLAIITRLIELLETFVGRELSMRLLSNVLPKAIPVDQTSSKENNNG